jgi:hypothetical protein
MIAVRCPLLPMRRMRAARPLHRHNSERKRILVEDEILQIPHASAPVSRL